MKKIEAFKDSEGNIFENERDYVLSEAEIQRKMIVEHWKELTDIISKEPEMYFNIIRDIGNAVIDKKSTRESIGDEYEDHMEIFNKEKEIKGSKYKYIRDKKDYNSFFGDIDLPTRWY